MTIDEGVVGNVGVATEISDISIQSGDRAYFRFLVAIFVSGCRSTSDSVGSMTIESGVVGNADVATEISLISQSSPEIWRTFGYRSPFWFPVVGRRRTVLAV